MRISSLFGDALVPRLTERPITRIASADGMGAATPIPATGFRTAPVARVLRKALENSSGWNVHGGRSLPPAEEREPPRAGPRRETVRGDRGGRPARVAGPVRADRHGPATQRDRGRVQRHGQPIVIGATANPFGGPMEDSFVNLRGKAEAGADFVQTQAIFDLDAFEEWMHLVRKEWIHEKLHILAGVVPLKSAKAARFMNEKVP